MQLLLWCGLLVVCVCSYATIVGAGARDDPFRAVVQQAVDLRRLQLAPPLPHSYAAGPIAGDYNSAAGPTGQSQNWQQSTLPDDDDSE